MKLKSSDFQNKMVVHALYIDDTSIRHSDTCTSHLASVRHKMTVHHSKDTLRDCTDQKHNIPLRCKCQSIFKQANQRPRGVCPLRTSSIQKSNVQILTVTFICNGDWLLTMFFSTRTKLSNSTPVDSLHSATEGILTPVL